MTRKYGSRQDVIDGLATKTRGGLTADDLFVNPKSGKIVSKRKSEIAKANYKTHGFNKRKAPEPEPAEEAKPPKKKRRRRKKKDE